jgi:hypothetical protein
MRKRWEIVALTAVVVLSSSLALAGGRGRRSGVVMSPFGPVYDTRSPEWRASGGNVFVYQQLMELKLQRQREQILLKQQQMLDRAARAKKVAAKGKAAHPEAMAPLPAFDDLKKAKKKRTYVPTGAATSAEKSVPTTAKPGDTMDDPLKAPPATTKPATAATPKSAPGT